MTRARELGLGCGDLPTGARNSIADVAGVRVGHASRTEGDLRTGVTAILPHGGDVFRDRPRAASHVLNGFGKSIGLMQIDELGTLETPILLTNTLSVGTCGTALIRRAIAANPQIGRGGRGTVNPVVLECNDGFLNDIQALAVSEADAGAALDDARADFAVGSVGAGTGMSCFGFKGGVGTASRRLRLDGAAYHLGVLVLANFGRAGDLLLPDGRRLAPPAPPAAESGSVIVILATDIPLEHRQLQRVIRRAGVGLARCGAFWGNGSGDVFVGFTTADRVDADGGGRGGGDFAALRALAEGRIDKLFQATAEATQEAVLDAMAASDTMTGRDGNRRIGLRHALGGAA
ncbi:MAG: P1 family peptidase [Rhodospirillales bacterium]|nr:P1 family peptidase [Rhodospirillales bacterium]